MSRSPKSSTCCICLKTLLHLLNLPSSHFCLRNLIICPGGLLYSGFGSLLQSSILWGVSPFLLLLVNLLSDLEVPLDLSFSICGMVMCLGDFLYHVRWHMFSFRFLSCWWICIISLNYLYNIPYCTLPSDFSIHS